MLYPAQPVALEGMQRERERERRERIERERERERDREGERLSARRTRAIDKSRFTENARLSGFRKPSVQGYLAHKKHPPP